MLVPIQEIKQKALKHIKLVQEGKISAFKTPWAKLDNQLVKGIPWSTIMTIVAEPGSGKTAMADAITDDYLKNNNDSEISILKFQLEMTDVTTGLRSFAKTYNTTLQELCDPDKKISDTWLTNVEKDILISEEKIYQVNDPLTSLELEAYVEEFYNKKKGKIVIYVDHTVLLKRDSGERTQLEALESLYKTLIRLKKKIPYFIAIVLSQSNRELESIDRRVEANDKAFPTRGDIYGGEPANQCSDVILFLIRPRLKGISIYGSNKYLVAPEHIAVHIIKNRNNGPVILWFKENLKYFKIEECDPPKTR